MIDAKSNLAYRWLSRTVVVPINRCVHYCAFRYGCGAFNPYENYAIALNRGEPVANARERFVDFLRHYRPRTFGEALGVKLDRDYGLWQFPWLAGPRPAEGTRPGWADDPDDFPDIITHFSERGILRFRIEEEFLWSERLFYSMRRKGYNEALSRRFIEACELVAENGDTRYLILDGNHRVSTLAALGQTQVSVRCLRGRSIRAAAVASWPRVREGTFVQADALRIFGAYFTGNDKPRTTDVPASVIETNQTLPPCRMVIL